MKTILFNQALGAELVSLGNDCYSCRFCMVTKNKNALVITNTKTVEGNISVILDAFIKDMPTALTLSGKGIIHKVIQVNQDTADSDRFFYQAFPSVEPIDFYIQQFYEDDKAFVSIMRRHTVDDILAKMKQAKINVYILSFGGVVLQHIMNHLDVYGNPIQIGNHLLTYNINKQLVGYEYIFDNEVGNWVKIDEEKILEENVVAYATAFQVILYDGLNLIQAELSSVKSKFATFLSNLKIKKKAALFILFIFTSLVLSTVLFFNYSQENEALATNLNEQLANAEQIKAMHENISKNVLILKQLNWNGGYNYGFLVNEIGQSMPGQLQLQEVAINAYQTEQEKKQRPTNIKITGTTVNLISVNNWIFILKEKPWVKSVRLVKFQGDSESTISQFKLTIIY
jgi:hypothetical protein